MAKEKRIARRQPLRYGAWIGVTDAKPRPCLVSDISQSGARLDLGSNNADVPGHFVLMLSRNGAARRYCTVMWRRGTEMGVKFARSLADAEKATLVPQPNADAQAAEQASAEGAQPAQAAAPAPAAEAAKPEPATTA